MQELKVLPRSRIIEYLLSKTEDDNAALFADALDLLSSKDAEFAHCLIVSVLAEATDVWLMLSPDVRTELLVVASSRMAGKLFEVST